MPEASCAINGGQRPENVEPLFASNDATKWAQEINFFAPSLIKWRPLIAAMGHATDWRCCTDRLNAHPQSDRLSDLPGGL
jgi:hypothetical protein